ncbi:peptide chain release factor N(5)-glutamine methyltransferase [Cytophagales bacterium LB-30]|uniref:Release factor glutamine methyltransferase n=1 Tax=Shiella aurantiaca TaxID=3058365 RepID=A0ABT8F865_9BACT|nr:peptide chain release factor N(5)-glutamine methyltransferase [Shiella aurantiaca]MDN4166678.1 peptide chain release factor N(5)-glutamine methyltransferase [Shiella aurantiaca]
MTLLKAKIIQKQLLDSLIPLVGDEEAKGYTRLIMEKIWALQSRNWLLNPELSYTDAHKQQLEEIITRVARHEPIQYILEEAWFYGRSFRVNPSVLIPRPETEELVHWIASDFPKKAIQVLDIGTGSGCIPITLGLENPSFHCYGLDISEEALKVARSNAEKLGAKVEFFQIDILQQEIPLPKVDVVVSNPPYIRPSEQAHMQANVLAHEPHLALFIEENDPLLFYRTIAHKAKKCLVSNGLLYFEINEAFGAETVALLQTEGYTEIELRKDMQGKDRMVRGLWKG